MKPRRQYHIHSTLLMYAFVAMLLAVGAFTSQNNLLFWCFGLAIALLLASGIISGAMMLRIRVERAALADADAGRPARVRYLVTNTSRWLPVFGLLIREERPAPDSNAEAAEQQAQLDAAPTTFVAYVAPGRTIEVDAPFLATSRGRIRLDRFTVETSFPFGIVRKSLRYGQPAAAVARPRAIAPGEMPTGGSGRQLALESPASARAPGQEYVGLREYQPGDSPRLIAWRASARQEATAAVGTGLLVRQTSAQSPGRLHVILDLDAEATDEGRELAIERAAGLVVSAATRGVLVSLTVPTHNIHSGLRTGARHAEAILVHLALLPATAPGRGRTVRARIGQREPCVVVHAGAADATVGPPWARRVEALRTRAEAAA